MKNSNVSLVIAMFSENEYSYVTENTDSLFYAAISSSLYNCLIYISSVKGRERNVYSSINYIFHSEFTLNRTSIYQLHIFIDCPKDNAGDNRAVMSSKVSTPK